MRQVLGVPASPLPRRTLHTETVLVLGVSLGASAIWAVLSILRKLTAETPLSAQTTRMNTSSAPDRPWLDLAYQLAGIAIALVPVVLALHLLGRELARPARLQGFDLTRPGRDLLLGVVLAAGIGIPGLGLYLAARELGLNTTIAAANLPSVWWAVPVLVLGAQTTIAVMGRAIPVREAALCDNCSGKVRMVRVDARVQHGNAFPGACQPI